MKELTIVLDDGFRVGVMKTGPEHGTPLVFLHGLAVSGRAYVELLTELGERGFYVVALDAADHGRSSSLPWGHNMEDMADVTKRALDYLGIGHAIMVGHSMGGALVTQFAADYPDMTTLAIMLNAAIGKEHHEMIRLNTPLCLWNGARFLAGAVKDVVGDAVRAGRARSIADRVGLARILRDSVSGPGVLKAIVAMTRHNTVPLLDYMRIVGVPTLIVHGTEDGIIGVTSAITAGRVAECDVLLLPGQFHSWMIVDPVAAADVIVWAVEETTDTVLGSVS